MILSCALICSHSELCDANRSANRACSAKCIVVRKLLVTVCSVLSAGSIASGKCTGMQLKRDTHQASKKKPNERKEIDNLSI